jgi:Fe-S-cluster-containing hydrogenase component 2
MGHLGGDHIYEKLGSKIDNLQVHAPWNENLYNLLKELYTTDEAELVVKMPYGMADFDRVMNITGFEKNRLQKNLDNLTSKGLVMDFYIGEKYYYMPSPMIIGIFEFTMMRTRGELNSKLWAELLDQYLDQGFFDQNYMHGVESTYMRALPHESVIKDMEHMEVLDYESARAIVERSDKFSMGTCSCRHKKHHLGEKKCDTPLEKCSSFGYAAEFLTSHGFAREVSKSEMLDNLEHSRETGLVLNADNVKRNITYMCHCCKDCCVALRGISKFGYPRTVVTSNFIAQVEEEKCIGCGKCAKACCIDAIEMDKIENPTTKKKKNPRLDSSICLGCGVCALKCDNGSMKLVSRDKRVFTPESTFERVILMNLERGNLQNQMFDNPQSKSEDFMRAFVGGFLRLTPVKKALLSDTLRSSFLNFMKTAVKKQGKAHLLEI